MEYDQELMDFFDFSKEFKREAAPQGYISSDPSNMAVDPIESKVVKREVIGTDYVAEIVAKEKLRLNGVSNIYTACCASTFCLFTCNLMQTLRDDCPQGERNRTMNDLDTDDEEDEFEIRRDDEYYKKYRFNLNRDRSLPIYAKREEILAAINANPVVILKGETGCGKTTQVSVATLSQAF